MTQSAAHLVIYHQNQTLTRTEPGFRIGNSWENLHSGPLGYSHSQTPLYYYSMQWWVVGLL